MPSAPELLRSFTTDPDEPLRQGRYQSPLRDERLAAWLGASLGILFTVCFVTGMYSHIQQHPLTWLPIPAGPAGLFRITQGVHVACGIAILPVLLAKLWLVWPRLLSWPPLRQVADVVERLGVLVLVAAGIFMVFSGLADIALWYPWRFSFPAAHYWMAWIAMGAIIAHLGAKWAITRRTFARRDRRRLDEADPVLRTEAEPPHDGLTRRGFLTTVAAASGVLTAATIGQTLPELRDLAILAPRKASEHPINRSAADAGVVRSIRSPTYRLAVIGQVTHPLEFDLDQLLAMALHQAVLPIACVEGWSYSATWRGVRLRDLLEMAGAAPHASCEVVSLQRDSIYARSFVDHQQAHAATTLLATHLDGARLSPDHGYPLRLIAPNRPGVNQTKWVTEVVVT